MKNLILGLCIAAQSAAFSLPASFDLRNTNGKNLVSAVKKQSGGTCWTHGTMAAIESNLLVKGTWQSIGESGEADLAEYHLDWWNGFNKHYNADIAPSKAGLTVHEGGDYLVAAAYFARGTGGVRDSDAQSFSSAPSEKKESYRFFYPRDIEWFEVGENLENIDRIKTAIMENGAIGTALAWSSSFFSNNTFYQPKSNGEEANHAVSIVGWDDNKTTKAPKPGAWLVKNSWGTSWGSQGYFWISYYDKVACRHPEMGAVSFKNVEVLKYKNIYFHDYHGWRDTKQNASEAFNAFVAKGAGSERESLKSVSFYTAAQDVEYTVKIFRKFSGGELEDLMSVKEGVIDNKGFHTVDLSWPVRLHAGDKFYVYLRLSKGGQAFDRTSNVPVLLGSHYRTSVESKATAGESFYKSAGRWVDLTNDEKTGNFCIKGLSIFE